MCVRQTDRDAESVCVLCGGQQVQRPLSWKKSHRFREREGPVSMGGGSAPPKSAFPVCTVGPRARLWAGEGRGPEPPPQLPQGWLRDRLGLKCTHLLCDFGQVISLGSSSEQCRFQSVPNFKGTRVMCHKGSQ